jgi:hypothetical protein
MVLLGPDAHHHVSRVICCGPRRPPSLRSYEGGAHRHDRGLRGERTDGRRPNRYGRADALRCCAMRFSLTRQYRRGWSFCSVTSNAVRVDVPRCARAPRVRSLRLHFCRRPRLPQCSRDIEAALPNSLPQSPGCQGQHRFLRPRLTYQGKTTIVSGNVIRKKAS